MGRGLGLVFLESLSVLFFLSLSLCLCVSVRCHVWHLGIQETLPGSSSGPVSVLCHWAAPAATYQSFSAFLCLGFLTVVMFHLAAQNCVFICKLP